MVSLLKSIRFLETFFYLVKAAVLAFTENYERETVSANSEDSDSDQKNPFNPELRSFEDFPKSAEWINKTRKSLLKTAI